MGWRYRKRIKIAPGIHLNISKSGISTTIGPRGASVNIGPNGTYVNTGIPGTGLYNRQKISTKAKERASSNTLSSDKMHTYGRNSFPKRGKIEFEVGCIIPLLVLFFIILFVAINVLSSSGLLTSGGLIVAIFLSAIVVGLVFFLFNSWIKLSVNDDKESDFLEEVSPNLTLPKDLPEANEAADTANSSREDTISNVADVGVPVSDDVAETSRSYIAENIKEEDEVAEETNQPCSPVESLEPYDPKLDLESYRYPTINLLKIYDVEPYAEDLRDQLIYLLRSFGVEISSIKCTAGPRITLYELTLAPGLSISQLYGLEDDIALSMCSHDVKISPIRGKGTIGIFVPNPRLQIVPISKLFQSRKFQETVMELPCALGLTITNEVFMFDLSKAPHLLIAGSAGQGKSIALHVIICSLLYKKHPSELKLVLMDPMGTEFAPYQLLEKHFLAAAPYIDSIVNNARDALTTLASLITEMNKRYRLFAMAGAREIKEYNELFRNRMLNPAKGHIFMPRIVVVIDAYNVLAMGYEQELMHALTELTTGARAVGIHVIIATTRPTSDIISSTMKSHIPTRISFAMPERIDSQIILDDNGAEELIGPGDMIFKDKRWFVRIQCAFVDTPELEKIATFIACQQSYNAPFALPRIPMGDTDETANVDINHLDPLFADVARYIVQTQIASTALVQRAFSIGYNRAGRLLDQLEAAGIVGPARGAKPRDVLILNEDSLDMLFNNLGYF